MMSFLSRSDTCHNIFIIFLQAWLTEINEYAQEDVVIMLLGNKADMTGERVIKSEDGEKLAKVRCIDFVFIYIIKNYI